MRTGRGDIYERLAQAVAVAGTLYSSYLAVTRPYEQPSPNRPGILEPAHPHHLRDESVGGVSVSLRSNGEQTIAYVQKQFNLG